MIHHDIEENRAIALQFLERAFDMQMDTALSMLTEEATWWVQGDPDRVKIAGLKNRQQTEKMLSRMHKYLPNGMRHQVTGVTAENDRVAVEVRAEGTWFNGEPYKNNYHFLIQLRQGKVAAIREYLDTMQLP
jgi:uncharacterized protein